MTREEAIEKVRHMSLPKETMEILETLATELKESEDERIRKDIVAAVEMYGDFTQSRKEEIYAYLEKQKEPVVDKEGMYYYLGGKFIYCGYPATEVKQKESLRDFINNFPYSDEQKEQKPSINIDQLKSMMLQYLQEATNEKDDSDIEADTDKWARKILGYDFEQKPIIKGWVARDKALQLNFYTNKPKRGKTYWIENGGDSVQIMPDPEHLYEEQDFDTLDWKDEPIEVELVVRASTEKRQKHVPENEETGTRQEQKPVEKISVSEELYEHIRNACACIDDAMSSDTLCDMTDYLEMADSSAKKAFDMVERSVVKQPADCIEDSLSSELDEMAEKAALQAYPVKKEDDPMGANYPPIDVNENERWAYEEGFKAGRESGLRDGQKYVLNNLDSYGLCKHAEWSEEDEDTINLMIAILRENHPNGLFKTNPVNTTCMSAISTDMLIKRIESLRPQPHWKPSKDQMKALQNAIVACGSEWVYRESALRSLFTDLKKLI